MAEIAHDSLSARMNVQMPDRYVLSSLAPFPRQRFDLHGVGAHKLVIGAWMMATERQLLPAADMSWHTL
jgi:hypothetical protein